VGFIDPSEKLRSNDYLHPICNANGIGPMNPTPPFSGPTPILDPCCVPRREIGRGLEGADDLASVFWIPAQGDRNARLGTMAGEAGEPMTPLEGVLGAARSRTIAVGVCAFHPTVSLGRR